MQQLICGKLIDKYVLVNRFGKKGAIINQEKYRDLFLLSENKLKPPTWLKKILAELGIIENNEFKTNDYILFKDIAENTFGRVSYEITEKCNFNCRHCYLGKKKPDVLTTAEKKKIILTIEKSGCLWFQITGGEPLIDKDFSDVYNLAHSLGMLVTVSTNGSRLTDKKIIQTFKDKPPFRITLSIYGASENSYESLTRHKKSFKKFIAGLDWIKSSKITSRLNIVVTKHNENELEKMIEIAKKYCSEYFIYHNLSPQLNGNQAPLKVESLRHSPKEDGAISFTKNQAVCQAGITSFHVDSSGNASICKAVRNPNINIIQSGNILFKELPQISKKLFSSNSDCNNCSLKESCSTCPLLYKFYKRSGYLPQYLCAAKYTKERG